MTDGSSASMDSLPIPQKRMPRPLLRVPVDDVPLAHMSDAPPMNAEAGTSAEHVSAALPDQAEPTLVAPTIPRAAPLPVVENVVVQRISVVGVPAGRVSTPPTRSVPPPPPPAALMRTPSIPPPAATPADTSAPTPRAPEAATSADGVPAASGTSAASAAPIAEAPAAAAPVAVDATPPPDDGERTSLEGLEYEEAEDIDDDMEEVVEEKKPVAPAAAVKPPATPPTAPPAPPTDKMKKFRNWYDGFFDQDYLRTVRTPSAKAIARQVDYIENRFGLAPGSRILDVGSGLGLQANELGRRGYQVIGLDSSKTMVQRSKEDAADYGTPTIFVQGDMREMTFDFQFDGLLCWGTTFGFFEDETNRLVLLRMREALREGGRLVLEIVNRDFVIQSQPNLVWFEGDGCVCMEETQFNSELSMLEVFRSVMLDEGRKRESNYCLRLYAVHEIMRELEHFGFRVLSLSGGTSTPGVFFGADSPKIIIQAERKTSTTRTALPPVPRPSLAPGG